MRTPSSPLLPLLRSRVQGDVLALLYLDPDTEYSVSEIATQVAASVKAVHHEISRLVESGLLVDRKRGNLRLVRAEQESVVFGPLSDLLAVTYGPLPVLEKALADVDGIEQAFIYGSWAARYRGEQGTVPGDVDVVVVGDADPDTLDDRALAAEPRLRRAVNIHRVRADTWDAQRDPFVSTIRSRPLVPLRGVDS